MKVKNGGILAMKKRIMGTKNVKRMVRLKLPRALSLRLTKIISNSDTLICLSSSSPSNSHVQGCVEGYCDRTHKKQGDS